MWYSIDFNKLAWNLLKVALKKPFVASYIWSLLKPIKTLHVTWQQYRKDNIYKIEHNAQVCYFEAALNDRFDSDLRRIYIDSGIINDLKYIYTEAEQQTPEYVYIQTEDTPLWIFTEGETGDTGADFIVYVPASIMLTQNHEVRALIEYYRLGGKRYIIIEI